MKKILDYVLVGIGIVGTALVGQGLITGEQLTSVQNIVGIAMAGGGFTTVTIIRILTAIPKELINAGYNKAVEKYGQKAVDNVFVQFDELMELMNTVNIKLDEVKQGQEEDREARNNLLNS